MDRALETTMTRLLSSKSDMTIASLLENGYRIEPM